MPPEQYALDLIQRLYKHHRLRHWPTEFVEARGARTRLHKGQPQIILSRQGLARTFEQGFQEYPALMPLISWCKNTGLAGVHLVCVHEFAHVLQYDAGCFDPEEPHEGCYVVHYRNLLHKFPPINNLAPSPVLSDKP